LSNKLFYPLNRNPRHTGALHAVIGSGLFQKEEHMTQRTKLRIAWKYRRQIWKYRKLIIYRKEIAGVLAATTAIIAAIALKRGLGERAEA
jgi:hypothetical protein